MTTNVLFLCTHNSARSILAESMLNHLAGVQGRPLHAFSAGSAPSGTPNPVALAVLDEAGIDTSGLRSKSWDQFAGDAAPRMRIVVTVCDRAAAETCPYWPGGPVRVHWGYRDPSNAVGGDKARRDAFELTRQALGYRLLQLLQLPIESMSDAELQSALTGISRN